MPSEKKNIYIYKFHLYIYNYMFIINIKIITITTFMSNLRKVSDKKLRIRFCEWNPVIVLPKFRLALRLQRHLRANPVLLLARNSFQKWTNGCAYIRTFLYYHLYLRYRCIYILVNHFLKINAITDKKFISKKKKRILVRCIFINKFFC